VFLQLCWIYLFGKQSLSPPLTPKLQEVFLSRTNSIIRGKQCARSSSSNRDGFLWEIHLFLHLSSIGLFGRKWAFLHLEYSICGKYSFQKRTQFTQGNNELDVTASNIDDLLWKDTWLLQLSWVCLFGENRGYLHLEIPKLQEVFFSKTNSILKWNNVLDGPASTTNGVLSRATFVSST
jgi:hypothetical protein